MTLAIMQPYFFPYIGYFQLLNAVDKFIIYDDVNYINRGWINRNRISLNGQSHTFTIPISKASQNKRIIDLNLSDDLKWKNKLLLTFKHAYRKAPFFDLTFPKVERIINYNDDNLSSFIHNSIVELKVILGISTEIISSSTKYENENLSGQERIIDICLKENADHYLNPIGGMELYSNTSFEKNNIKLGFLQTDELTYDQGDFTFTPHLSVIDIMMYQPPEVIKELMNRYKIIPGSWPK